MAAEPQQHRTCLRLKVEPKFCITTDLPYSDHLYGKRALFEKEHKQGHSSLDLLFNFGGAVDKLMRPKLVLMILDELDEGDQKTPWMRPIHYQALQQNPVDKIVISIFVFSKLLTCERPSL